MLIGTTDEPHQQMVKNKKGIIKMTTNETTEIITNQQIAENVVKDLPANEIVKEIQRLLDEKDHYKKQCEENRIRANQKQSKYLNIYDSVAECIKNSVKEDSVTIDDLKELAEELNIELTKSIRVTFTVKCEYEFNVPLDWTDDDISDGDFDIRISSNLNDDDIEETSESMEVEDFEVEDNG